MKTLINIIIGLILGIIEITLAIHVGGIAIHVFIATIVGISLILIGRERQGATILLASASVAEIYSPFRLGFFILSTVALLAMLHLLVRQSVEVSHPLIVFGIFLLALLTVTIIQFLFDPLWISHGINIILNAFLGLGITYLLTLYIPTTSNNVRISDDVHFR